ncbi:DUF6710 family protein [Sporosarcina highlanderae]|uniref:Fip n=1 Tax=Sporosarcina highlanderae TaxID=3035916 RepID=A0ABT8JSS8_9BACL|nr:DUF6710 family protein [Sporosarcina highlanderae]MDN4608216.1 hypothetical protein [Sporosarcina highlanderae]
MIKFRKRLPKAIKQQPEIMYNPPTSMEVKNRFENIMRFSKSVLDVANEFEKSENDFKEKADHSLVDVVRLLGRQLQSQYLTNLIYGMDETLIPKLHPSEVLFESSARINLEGTIFSDIIKKVDNEKIISLNRDLILPWPWKESRLISCIANIGQGRRWGQWRQDDNNHYVDLWLPMGIAWVFGGNHSISTGIIQGKGEIVPRDIYDISDVYDYVYCDGVNYYRKDDGSIISPVKNAEFAAIFEIGRMMVENSISY